MSGFERLKELYQTEHQNTDKALVQIIKYLLHQQEMEAYYLNPEKNFKQMNDYIRDKAREFEVNNVACIVDETVYEWAIEYFSKSNDELGINKPKVNVNLNKVAPKKAKEDNSQMSLDLAVT